MSVRAEVVVDRLRHAHDGNAALLVQAQRDAERVVAADRDQGVDTSLRERRADVGRAVGALGVGVRARGAEDRAAAGEQSEGLLDAELDRLVFQHARPAVAVADERVIGRQPAAHDGPDHGVQPRAVAPAGEHSDARHGRRD